MSSFQKSLAGSDSLRELFLIACKNGEESQVKAALVLGVDVNFKSELRPETGLMLAIRGNHEGVIDILLSNSKIQVNASDKDRASPLALASSLGLASVVAKLGKKPTLKLSVKGVNERAFVGSFDSDQIFGRLLSNVSNWTASLNNKSTPLSLAAQKGDHLYNTIISLCDNF